MTPYEVAYNQAHLIHLPYSLGETKVEAIERTMQRIGYDSSVEVLSFESSQ